MLKGGNNEVEYVGPLHFYELICVCEGGQDTLRELLPSCGRLGGTRI